MESYLAQLILAVRSDDVEKWANILLVVVLAVFWAVAGLLKAKKAQQGGEEEQPGSETGQKPSSAVRALRKRLLQQSARAQPPTSAPAARYQAQARQRLQAAVRPQPAVKRQPVQIPTAAPIEKPSPVPAALEPGLIKVIPEPISKSIEGLPEEYAPEAEEKVEHEFAVESLLDYADPDELRRAILHYEILGKPLSLRRPGEHIIGL